MAALSWIRMYTDIFDNNKIKIIRNLPEGNDMFLLWIFLLTQAGKCNEGGIIYLTEDLPMDDEMLSILSGLSEQTVKTGLSIFEKFDMLSCSDNGYLSIIGWEEHQSEDRLEKRRNQDRMRKKTQRAKQKQKEQMLGKESQLTDKSTRVVFMDDVETVKQDEEISIDYIKNVKQVEKFRVDGMRTVKQAEELPVDSMRTVKQIEDTSVDKARTVKAVGSIFADVEENRMQSWYDTVDEHNTVTEHNFVMKDNLVDKRQDKDIGWLSLDHEEDRNSSREVVGIFSVNSADLDSRQNIFALYENEVEDYGFPDTLVEKLREWMEYKSDRQEPYAKRSLKAFLKKMSELYQKYGEQALCDLADESMANGWKNLLWKELEKNNWSGRTISRSSPYMESIQNRVDIVDSWI